MELSVVVFPTCSVRHVNYEQSLVNMINTVPLKDYVGQLVTSIIQLCMRKVGIEDGEQRESNGSKIFSIHSLIRACDRVSFAALISESAYSSQKQEI